MSQVFDPICCDPQPYQTKFFNLDPIPFQFEVPPCPDATDYISNGTFNQPDGGGQTDWNTFGGVAYNLGGSLGAWLQEDGSAIQQTTLGMTDGEWALLRIDVNIIGPFESSNSFIRISGIGQTIDIVAATATYEFYVQAGFADQITFTRITDNVGNEQVFIQSVQLLEIEFPIITAIDLEGNLLAGVPNTTYSNGILAALYQPNAQTIAAGCFRFRLQRSCDVDWFSEPIQLIEEDPCYLLIGGCSNNNFLSPVSDLYIRIDAQILPDQSPEYERFVTRQTSGTRRLNYGRMDRVYTLKTERLPATLRDYLFTLPLFNVIGVKEGSGEQRNFFVLDEPDSPEFSQGDDSLASVRMQLVEKTQLTETIYTGPCNFVLPPKALGSRFQNFAIKAAEDTAIKVP